MKGLRLAILLAVAGGTVLTAGSADAQSWAYHRDVAAQAYDAADANAWQARRDQREAQEAADVGDDRAAYHFARGAAYHRARARDDARYARHEDRVARRDAWRDRW